VTTINAVPMADRASIYENLDRGEEQPSAKAIAAMCEKIAIPSSSEALTA
jgi:hypothetical protein